MENQASIIDVVHVSEEGWETFTSPHIPGLYMVVGSTDLQAAYEDVPRAIESLIFHDTGRRVLVRPEKTYGEYLKARSEPNRSVIRHYSVEPVPA